MYFVYIKLKTYKTSSNSRRFGKVEILGKSHFHTLLPAYLSCPK